MLETDLNKFDGIFAIHLVQKEKNHVQQLFHLQRLSLIWVLFVLHLGNHRWEAQITEGLHPLEQAWLTRGLLATRIGGLRGFGFELGAWLAATHGNVGRHLRY